MSIKLPFSLRAEKRIFGESARQGTLRYLTTFWGRLRRMGEMGRLPPIPCLRGAPSDSLHRFAAEERSYPFSPPSRFLRSESTFDSTMVFLSGYQKYSTAASSAKPAAGRSVAIL